MTAKYWLPRPKAGDIVQCRFPEQVGSPGPKERPALVMEVEEALDDPKGCVVTVAYATSQRTNEVHPSEFVVDAGDRSGLAKATKFDLVNRHRLPFNEHWFGLGPAPGKVPPHPRRGRLDLEKLALKRRLQAAVTEALAKRKH